MNAYLHAHTQAPASAKVFRTWGATVAAVAVLAGAEPPADVSARSRERLAVGAAATLLGDTASVTRSSYIHPAWIDVGRSDLVAAAVAESSDRAGTRAVAEPLYRPWGPGSGPLWNHRCDHGGCGARREFGSTWTMNLRSLESQIRAP